MRNVWLWLGGIVVVALALVAVGWRFLEGRRFAGELSIARDEVNRGAFESALRRLRGLAALRAGRSHAEVMYWMAACESARGRHKAALQAVDEAASTSPFADRAVLLRAGSERALGRFRDAEATLTNALAKEHGETRIALLDALERLLQGEARFEDLRRFLRAELSDARDPIRILHKLWMIDWGTIPAEAIRRELDRASRLAPNDDRVWLGRARLAIREGDLTGAQTALEKCIVSGTDESVWRAWLDLARAADKPDQAVRALRQVGAERLGADERSEWRAWLLDRMGRTHEQEQVCLERLNREPHNPRLLEKLAELSLKSGKPDRAAEFRRRKAEVDHAFTEYEARMSSVEAPGSLEECLMMSRLAERSGRRDEAEGWSLAALRKYANSDAARATLARLRSATPDLVSTPWEGLDQIPTSSPKSDPASSPARVKFVDDAQAAGLHFDHQNGQPAEGIRQMPESMCGGIALLDYDTDGWIDVYCVQGGTYPPTTRSCADKLYRNRHDGTFEDVSDRTGISALPGGYGHGATVGDFDNDGDPDLFITRWDSYALYRNRGDGTFEDASEALGLGGKAGRGRPSSAAFADLDGDGDLDLFVCHYLTWDPQHPRLCRDNYSRRAIYCSPLDFPAEPDRLFRNDGDRFTDVTKRAGIVDVDGRGLGVVAADFDLDGRLDLFVANDKGANQLWHNLGGMRFEDAALLSGVAGAAGGGYQAGMGIACGDLDGDGRLDLAVTNFYGESTTLYHNMGGGLFIDRSATSGLAALSRHRLGFGAAFLDVDNNGRLDLVTANGHVNDLGDTPYRMAVQLLLSAGGGRLEDATSNGGEALAVPRLGRGLAFGDLDNDGRIDVLVQAINEPLAWLHNQSPQNGHSVTLLLEGSRSSRDAVGARVTVTGGGRAVTAVRLGGGSYQSASDPRVHVGLGESTVIDRVEIAWPSGQVDRHEKLDVDVGYKIREGSPARSRLPGFRGGR